MRESFILSLSFGNYLKADGGVDKAIKEYQEIFNSNGISYVHVSPLLPSGIAGSLLNICHNYLYTLVIDGVYKGVLDEEELNLKIFRIAKVSSINAVHIHHTKKFRKDFFRDLFEWIKAPVYFFIHDYFSICDHPNLLRNDLQFCGESEKNAITCQGCKYSSSLSKHRDVMQQISTASHNTTIVAPSEVALRIWKNTYNYSMTRINYVVMPHQCSIGEFRKVPNISDRIKIAFIGRFDTNKGRDQWISLCNYVQARHLPYQLYYFGFSEMYIPNVTRIYVKVTPDNPNMMLDELRNREINAVFLWSICPETYSYTYFEALASNCFILTNKDSGNISSMTQTNNNGKVFQDIEELIQFLTDTSQFINILEGFADSGKFGPASYSHNKEILTLCGDEFDSNFVEMIPKRNKVNKTIKAVADKLYTYKNLEKREIRH